MKYLLVLAGAAGVGPTPGSEEFMQMLGDYGTVTQAMAAAGVLVDSAPSSRHRWRPPSGCAAESAK